MREIKLIVIHHSGNASMTVSSIEKYHTVTKGWPSIGYHYVIDRYGCVMNTAREEIAVYGSKGVNTVSIHICVIGNFEKDVVYTSQADALKMLRRDLLIKYPKAIVVMHKDVRKTLCPGKYMERYLTANGLLASEKVRAKLKKY